MVCYWLIIEFDYLHEGDKLLKLLYSAGPRLSKQMLYFLSNQEHAGIFHPFATLSDSIGRAVTLYDIVNITTAWIKADVTYLVEQWNHIYDVDFTKETFECPLRGNQVQMMVLIHQIDDIRAKIGEFKKKDPTVPKEFHFHELNIRGKTLTLSAQNGLSLKPSSIFSFKS